MKADLDLARALLRRLHPDELRLYLRAEIDQAGDEGCPVDGFRAALDNENQPAALVDLYLDLLALEASTPPNPDEPDTLEDIRRQRPEAARRASPALNADGLFQRIYGGWLGRVAGCVLGKPVESNWSRRQMEDYLKLAGAYPLAGYVPRLSPMPEGFAFNPGGRGCCLGEVSGAPDDDDTDYSILGLHILEARGPGFTRADVAAEWLARLTYHHTWTAERAVYRNLILGLDPSAAARFLNPAREYIGARIRTAIYGLACPGNAERAAELAFHDAALSHTGNGIYSAMFNAACVAWAFVSDDLQAIIQAGLGEIPAGCRQSRIIRRVVDVHAETNAWEDAYDRLLAEMPSYNGVHAINNTAWTVLALLYGNGDFEKTICTAVMCGMDTDCNGADAGALIGAMLGAGALPPRWIEPLQDTLFSAVAGYSRNRISELARRTLNIARAAGARD